MSWFITSRYHASAMLWEMLRTLILGFNISAALQVFVSKRKMAIYLSRKGMQERGECHANH